MDIDDDVNALLTSRVGNVVNSFILIEPSARVMTGNGVSIRRLTSFFRAH